MGRERVCHDCRLGSCKRGEKKCEGLEEDLRSLDGRNYTWDFYGDRYGRDSVSIEQAAEDQMNLQEELDEQVMRENMYNNPDVVEGLPPCIRAKKSA